MKSVVDKDYEELEIKDDWNKKYDFEMQTGMYEEIRKRSRYYQSLIDSDCLNKGVLYRNWVNHFFYVIAQPLTRRHSTLIVA